MNELSSGFIPGIAASAMRERQGIQLGLEPAREVRLLMFSFRIEMRYKVIESPPIAGLVGLRSMVELRSSAMVAQIGRRAAAPGAPI